MSELKDLEALVAANEESFGADGDWDDDEDVSHPPTGITFGLIRRARAALAVLAAAALVLGLTACGGGKEPYYVGGCSYRLNTRSHVTLYVYSKSDDKTTNAALIKLAQICKAVDVAVNR